MIKEYTRAEFEAEVVRSYGEEALPDVMILANRWLGRGDGAAVYQNQDLGHPELGHIKIVSYGSPAAQLEVERRNLPDRLPDGLPAGAINWRYGLVGTYSLDEYVLARWEPVYGTIRRTPRPVHIVRNRPARYHGGFNDPALCDTNPTQRVDGKLAGATCRKCLRKAIELGIIQAPPELPDPVHGGDIFSRIEATEGR